MKHFFLSLTIAACAWSSAAPVSAQSSATDDEDLQSWHGVITNRTHNRRTGTICQYMSGPKAHGWHDFAPLPAAPIDSTCDDGAGSVGFVQPTGHGDQY